MVKKDYYAILGITPGASQEMVEAAYDRVPKGKTDETVPRPENVVAIPCYFGRIEYFVRGSEPIGGCGPIPTPSPTPTPTP